MQPQGKLYPMKYCPIHGKWLVKIFLWSVMKIYCALVDCYSKFLVVKKMDSTLDEDLIKATKVVFAEFGLPKKLLLDAGTNSVSERFKEFFRWLNIDQVMISSYQYQSNGQIEACIKFMKDTIKKCRKNNNDVNFALLKIRPTLITTGIQQSSYTDVQQAH